MKGDGILQFANCRMKFEIVFHITDMKSSETITDSRFTRFPDQ